jgi:hypothetical protein
MNAVGRSFVPYKALVELDRVIGHVAWEVTEVTSGSTLGRGKRDVVMGDVTISELRGGLLSPVKLIWSKAVVLEGPFAFALSVAPKRDPSRGFALSAQKSDEKGWFSWDSFRVDREGHAVKFQESGELGFSTGRTESGTDIIRTEFLTDVSLRLGRLKEGPRNFRLRVRILAGSIVYWPSLVHDVVLPN